MSLFKFYRRTKIHELRIGLPVGNQDIVYIVLGLFRPSMNDYEGRFFDQLLKTCEMSRVSGVVRNFEVKKWNDQETAIWTLHKPK